MRFSMTLRGEAKQWLLRPPTLFLGIAVFLSTTAQCGELSPVEQLGKSIFFDDSLSFFENQSCASCHGPEVGFTGPIAAFNETGSVYEGSIGDRFGNRKPPSAAYATQSPIFHFTRQGGGLFLGGNFWDGRATGERLGNPAADQAQGPFLNPVEQALPDKACVIERVCTNAAYPVAFDEVWEGACEIDWPADVDAQCGMEGGVVGLSEQDRDRVDTAYDSLGLTVAAYEASSEVNQFSSKFDAYRLGLADLSRQEKKGLSLFKGKGKCSRCHSVSGPPHDPPLFTDFSYDNLGVPRNPENPFYTMPPEFNPLGMDWIDLGLGGFLETRDEYQDEADDHYGAQKVPTLRNVDKRPNPEFPKAYAHNGYFKTLEGIVHFYNTRDVKPTCPNPFTTEEQALSADCWPEPEMPLNVNDSELGDLGLSSEEEVAIVAFLKTLSDGWLGSD